MPLDSMTSPTHPILGAAVAIAERLQAVADVEPLFMTTAEKAAALVQLQGDEAALLELKLRVLAAADDVADLHGARSAAGWLAHESHAPTGVLVGEEQLGTALAHHDQLRAALRDGHANVAQARGVVAALAALPSSLPADLRVRAEAVMVGHCAEFAPRDLKRLGSRLLEVLAPEIADAEEERRLRTEEEQARALARLQFTPSGDGVTRISASVPDSVAAMFKAQLHAFTSPRRAHLDRTRAHGELATEDPATGRRIPHAQLLGLAFCALVEHVPVDALPIHGNTTVSVVAMIDYDKLLAGLGGGTLSSGEPISAGEARRMACQAGILPAVLGSRGEVLDLGRRQRLFTSAQRKALAIRDRRCRAEGCDTPAAWTEAHHRDPWSRGGRTDLSDGVLLCSRHHHLVHQTDRYDRHWLPTGDVRFHRRS